MEQVRDGIQMPRATVLRRVARAPACDVAALPPASWMRPLLRAAGLLAVVIAAVTCTDAPTGLRHDGATDAAPARIGLAPSFSADAARAYRALAELGFDITSVRLRLTALDGRVAKDTVIAFPATRDTLSLDLTVLIQGSEQTFTARLDLRDANDVVLFTGTRLVTARATGLPGASPPTISLEYSGPGRDARALSVSPADATISATGSVSLAATAVDAAGRAVPDLLVRWTTSDASIATVTQTGNATAELRGTGKRGTATIAAVAPTGLSSSARVALVPPPARLVVLAGGAQSGVAGRPLAQPFAVELQATDGGPVPNALVSFRALTGGSVASGSVSTDAAGRASTSLTPGGAAGAYAFEASAPSVAAVIVSATATPAPIADLLLVSGDAQSDSIGRALPERFVVRVIDDLGGPSAGATVRWNVTSGSGTLDASSSVTDANGLASARYTVGRSPRSELVRASVVTAAGATASVDFSVRSIPLGPKFISFRSGMDQKGAAGSTLPIQLVVVVSDALGNPLPGMQVTWSASGLAATFSPTTSTTTNEIGHAATTVTLPSTAGTGIVIASTGVLRATTPITALAGAPTTFVVLTPLPSVIPIGVPPLTNLRVQLADAAGNAAALAGVVVTATAEVASSDDVVSSTATSDARGIVTFNIPSYLGRFGTAVVTLTAQGFTPLVLPPITFVTGPPAALRIVTQPSATAVSGAPFTVQPSVAIVDPGANSVAVAGTTVTAFIASGGGTLGGATSASTDATGTATFTDLSITGSAGRRTLGFRSGDLPEVRTIDIDVAAPSPSLSGRAASPR